MLVLNIDIHCACFSEVLKGTKSLFSEVLNQHVEHSQPCVDVNNSIYFNKDPNPEVEIMQYLQLLGSASEVSPFAVLGCTSEWRVCSFTAVTSPEW